MNRMLKFKLLKKGEVHPQNNIISDPLPVI